MSKKISKEVKEEIIFKVKQGRKAKEVAEEYGISDKTVYRLIGKSAEGDKTVIELSRMKRQNVELLRIVGQLIYEQELKKKGFNF